MYLCFRWLRKKLREELLKEGRKVHIRKSHMERYKERKIERRKENLDYLKKTYGDDYNIYWDKSQPCRRFVDKKFRYPIEETDSHLLGVLSEPDEEDEEWPELLSEGRVQSNLELITEVGIEKIQDDVFEADLDATLITMENRTSLGVKTIPSLKFDAPSHHKSAIFDEREVFERGQLTIPEGYESPKNASDVSIVAESGEDTFDAADSNQMQELDYIQHPVGTVTDSVHKRRVVSIYKKDTSEEQPIPFKEETSEDSDTQEEILDKLIDEYPETTEEKEQYLPEDRELEEGFSDVEDENLIESPGESA